MSHRLMTTVQLFFFYSAAKENKLRTTECRSIHKQNALTSMPVRYRIFENIDSLKATFPEIQEGVNFKKIELQWFSLPPSDTVFIGMAGKDTLLRIISTSYDSSDIVHIGNREVSLEEAKSLRRFRGTGGIQVSHFPEIYDYKNSYIVEGVVAGCVGTACNSFYIVIDK
ncbi:hypothetical protein [Terrimonas alba]|uniref:hypothetical protein n=1 Tax=Terrimonas alba TaxID=3349636 RepID=UPI0035F3E193